jgi:hypothetical protein
MPFIAKAVGPTGHAKWLTAPKRHGLRTFGPRELAAVFESIEEAQTAIGATILHEPCDGITFVAEPAHPPNIDPTPLLRPPDRK